MEAGFCLGALAKPRVPEYLLHPEFKDLGTENKFRVHPKVESLIGPQKLGSLKGSIPKVREN